MEENRSVVARGRERKKGLMTKRARDNFWDERNISYIDCYRLMFT